MVKSIIIKYKRVISWFIFFLCFSPALSAQSVNYSPAYFGPNANPVPEFTDATIAKYTTLQFSENYFFGFGDQTFNSKLVIEVPLLSEKVSIKLWNTFVEKYRVSHKISALRGMKDNNTEGIIWGGDIYIQTRILLLKERKYTPNIILNSTLKTASVKESAFENRRYFDTPGYYFDVEIGKSFLFSNNILSEIRPIVNIGFLCWETVQRQNDAPMYGGKIILSNQWIDLENSIAGYSGWMKNGDAPLIYSGKIIYKHLKFGIFANYKYGIHDFPYHQVEAGVSFWFDKLTPRYK